MVKGERWCILLKSWFLSYWPNFVKSLHDLIILSWSHTEFSWHAPWYFKFAIGNSVVWSWWQFVTDKSYLCAKILNIFVILSAVTSVISITIFGFGLEQKPCMDRLPWNLMELIYPVFMVILLGCAAIGTNNTFISVCLIIIFISWNLEHDFSNMIIIP